MYILESIWFHKHKIRPKYVQIRLEMLSSPMSQDIFHISIWALYFPQGEQMGYPAWLCQPALGLICAILKTSRARVLNVVIWTITGGLTHCSADWIFGFMRDYHVLISWLFGVILWIIMGGKEIWWLLTHWSLRCGSNFQSMIFRYIMLNNKNAHARMLQNITNQKSISVQVMAWYLMAPSHYLYHFLLGPISLMIFPSQFKFNINFI